MHAAIKMLRRVESQLKGVSGKQMAEEELSCSSLYDF